MQYSRALIFSKHTNLLPYFYAKYNGTDISAVSYDRLKARYSVERDVELILLVRYDGNKTICRIKCPINPMPVDGEFAPVSMHGVCAFLHQNGWVHKETYNLNRFM